MEANAHYMLHYACVTCRRSFKRSSPQFELAKVCPNCGANAINVGRHFKPPAESELRQWEKVRFLIEHGFLFHHVSDPERGYVSYPSTLTEARVFVERYREQACCHLIPAIRDALSDVHDAPSADNCPSRG